MTNNNLIPFSKELWETGEYEAVTRVNEAVKIYEADTDGSIFGRLGDISMDWISNGQVYSDGVNENDLMLRKKTKKVWIPLQEKFVFETKDECERYFSGLLVPIKAIKVEI